MKHLLLTVVLLAGIVVHAQDRGERNRRHSPMKDMTVEQIADLQTKKMTLALDLSDRQQSQVMELELERAEMRKAKAEERKTAKAEGKREKPDSDERYAMMSERLDRQIAHKENMRSILNKDQFEKWEKLNLVKAQKTQCRARRSK